MSSGSKKKVMEGFLRNVKTGALGYGEDKIERGELAAEGVDPCVDCPYRTNAEGYCSTMNCLPWFRYFQFRWRRIQRGLLGK